MSNPLFYVLLGRTPGDYGKSLPETILIAAADNEEILVEYMVRLPYGPDVRHGSEEIETVDVNDRFVCADSFEIRAVTWISEPKIEYGDGIQIENVLTYVKKGKHHDLRSDQRMHQSACEAIQDI